MRGEIMPVEFDLVLPGQLGIRQDRHAQPVARRNAIFAQPQVLRTLRGLLDGRRRHRRLRIAGTKSQCHCYEERPEAA